MNNHLKTNTYLKRIRLINVISINLPLLLVIPNYLNHCGYKNSYWTLAIFGFYIFILFSFWYFIYFIYFEVKYIKRNNINLFNHILKKQVSILGCIFFFTLYMSKIYWKYFLFLVSIVMIFKNSVSNMIIWNLILFIHSA